MAEQGREAEDVRGNLRPVKGKYGNQCEFASNRHMRRQVQLTAQALLAEGTAHSSLD